MKNNPELYLTFYKLTKYLYHIHHNMRKEYKYTLGDDVLSLAWQCLDKVVLANALPNKKKPAEIKKASAVFDQLKLRLRMAHELKLITHKQYAHIIKQNEEIGKMLAGWLKWAKKQ
jgi:hypothetical protein